MAAFTATDVAGNCSSGMAAFTAADAAGNGGKAGALGATALAGMGTEALTTAAGGAEAAAIS
jgi:hypothetical protein